MEPKNNEIVEIDLKELISVLLRKIWIVFLFGIAGAGCAGAYSKYMMEPVYTSSASVYIISRQDDSRMTFSDIQTSSSLAKDYMILVKSRPVTEEVIDILGLNLTNSELAAMVAVSIPSDSRILRITVSSTDPELARALADTIAQVSASHMVNIMEIEKVNIVEQANLPVAPSSPDIMKNAFLGGLAGCVLAVILLVILYLINDSIKTAEDIEKYLNLTTLGTIPMIDSKIIRKRKKQRKRVAA